MTRPAWVPPSVKLVCSARRPSGACSRLSELAPACSPEAASPCSSRSATSSTGAHTPMSAYVGRQPTRNVAGAHQGHRQHENALASVPVAEMAHEQRAHRPRDVRDPVGRKRQQRPGRRTGGGKEHLAEHERGRRAVDEEVVVLQDAADPAGQRRPPRRLAPRSVRPARTIRLPAALHDLSPLC